MASAATAWPAAVQCPWRRWVPNHSGGPPAALHLAGEAGQDLLGEPKGRDGIGRGRRVEVPGGEPAARADEAGIVTGGLEARPELLPGPARQRHQARTGPEPLR